MVLGRSPECQITIEDPLVSRQHARIRIKQGEAFISDLGSRNGVRVNGNLIQGETALKDEDRVRLGTQDLVFLVLGDQPRGGPSRATGFMRNCPSCGMPFPEESGNCPHCGEEVSDDDQQEETITGIVVEPSTTWTFQLLGDVIERALAAGRAQEAERMVRRAVNEVNQRSSSGARLEPANLSTVSVFAIRLAKLAGDPEWLEWALTAHREQGQPLTEAVLDQLEVVDWAQFESVLPFGQGLLMWWESEFSAGSLGVDKQPLSRFKALVERAGQA